MSVLESHVSSAEFSKPFPMSRIQTFRDYAESWNPDQTFPDLLSVTDLEIKNYVDSGKTTFVFDAESTFVENGGFLVVDDYLNWFSSLRALGVENIVITTNKRPKNEDDLWQMQAWAEQIGADALFSPLSNDQTKPSPHMLLQVMQKFGIDESQMVSFGDKMTADVLAANLAGVHSVLVERYGKFNHPGDELFVRPLERHILSPFLGRVAASNNVQKRYLPSDTSQLDTSYDASYEPEVKIDVPDYIRQKGILVGYGSPAVVLSPQMLERIPPPPLASLRNVIDIIKDPILANSFYAKYIKVLEENGEDYAEFMTKFRKDVIAPAILITGLLGLRKTVLSLCVLAHVTDHQDGFGIRKSGADLSSERRKKGANDDRNADQRVTVAMGVQQVLRGYKHPAVFAGHITRMGIRKWQIAHGASMGYNTKSDKYSKVAQELSGLDDLLTQALPNSKGAIVAQSLALTTKYHSLIESEFVSWPRRKYHKDMAAHVRRELTGCDS